MKKYFIFLVFFFLFAFISASSVEDEIQRVTYYAEEYETGNIDYVQLQLYLSSVRQNLNEILGVIDRNEGGLLNEDQIKGSLGEPTENTNWIWVESQEREKKLENSVPVWNKIIFDGKKIQIRLDAWPSLYSKKLSRIDNEIRDLEERGGSLEEIEELKKELSEESLDEGVIVYRLNFNVEFKRPEDQLNIQDKISEIQQLAQEFNSDPSNENAEKLAKESVNAERAFESYIRQGQNQCIDLMNSIFGSENQRGTEKLIVKEIVFYSGEDFESIARLEMCDDCEWSWIGLNFWVEARGFNTQEEEQGLHSSPEEYRNLEFEGFEIKVKELLEEYKNALVERDFKKANRISQSFWALNDAWSQSSNDVWQDIEKIFEAKRQSMTQEQQNEYYSNYGWVKDEQEKRKMIREIVQQNYEKRKAFYKNLFSSYELKKEFYYEQVSFEKRLVEEFKEFGEEICSNNIDDNNNEQIDCAESQCGGKFCGKETVEVTEGNETITKTVDLYCIAGTCQIKEEIIDMNVSICGNNICEEGEATNTQQNGTCGQDCITCLEYPPLECAGRVIFSGQDEQGCPLQPICFEEEAITCIVDEDCEDPLCGDATCVEGVCQVLTLTECRESECIDGQEKTEHCNSGESITVGVCIDGLWSETGVECESGEVSETEEIIEEEVVDTECSVRSDCGGENDVCSNGRCVTLPQVVEEEQEEVVEEELEEVEEEIGEEKSKESIVEEVPFNLFRAIGKITGAFITGFTSEEGSQESTSGTGEGSSDAGITQTIESQPSGEGQPPNEQENNWENEERDRRENECGDRCERECYDMEIRPCVEKCIFEECGQTFDCNVDETTNSCENSCKSEKDINVCEEECNENCMKGEETWKEPEREEHKEEKGVFNVGGSCRTAKAKTEGFIWFGGWGDPFERIQPLKTKYYSGGGDWCKWDLENLKKQRSEFEKGFNQEFVVWFFEKYLANSAEDWEGYTSGIFELYWKDVEISREIANRMKCLNMKELPEHDLIENIIYESPYGSIEFWEEITFGKIDREGEPVPLITPYMKIWIFPPKEIIKFEMKKSMEEHKFPGPQEEENNGELTESEKRFIRQDEGFMDKIEKLSDKYGGSFDGSIQIIDYETNDVIFNIYVEINEEDIMKITPMLPEETPKIDATMKIDFEKIYEIIDIEEKEMQGARVESPPWAPRKVEVRQKIKEATSGIKMYFKMRSLISSSEITPSSAEKDVESIIFEVMKMMMKDPEEQFEPEEESESGEEEVSTWESKATLTGNVIG